MFPSTAREQINYVMHHSFISQQRCWAPNLSKRIVKMCVSVAPSAAVWVSPSYTDSNHRACFSVNGCEPGLYCCLTTEQKWERSLSQHAESGRRAHAWRVNINTTTSSRPAADLHSSSSSVFILRLLFRLNFWQSPGSQLTVWCFYESISRPKMKNVGVKWQNILCCWIVL